MLIVLEVVETIVLVPTPEMGQPVTITDGLSTRGPSPSPSSSKRGRGDSPFTLVEGVSPKRTRL